MDFGFWIADCGPPWRDVYKISFFHCSNTLGLIFGVHGKTGLGQGYWIENKLNYHGSSILNHDHLKRK